MADSRRKVEITLRNASTVDSKVEIDGIDISNFVCGLDLHSAVGNLPTITLDLLPFEVHVDVEDYVRLEVPDGARSALIALGWAPPPDNPTSTVEFRPVGGDRTAEILLSLLRPMIRQRYGGSHG